MRIKTKKAFKNLIFKDFQILKFVLKLHFAEEEGISIV